MDVAVSNVDERNDRILELISEQKCCAQIVMAMGLETVGKTDAELIRAMRAPCFGFHGNHLCGALAAGSCLLSLCHEQYSIILVPELFYWFKEKYGSINCRDIIGTGTVDLARCTDLMAEVHYRCFALLNQYGIEPEK
ncbi:MAG: GCAxxG family protein [Firmicutes bacterium]|nr:GCAxxG family protein [Bacillota bacterium]